MCSGSRGGGGGERGQRGGRGGERGQQRSSVKRSMEKKILIFISTEKIRKNEKGEYV